ncbi:Uncharacterised protein [Vibrio cholerae]|nr:Uncharacterised protein [Vibrio cholerae]
MFGVEIVESTQIRIHIRMVLPCGRNQHAHRTEDIHPAG